MKKQLYLWLSVMVVVGLTMPALMGCAAPAKSPAVAPTPAAPAPGGTPQEGIKVHGNWTIDVLNTDGKLVSHREFENALTSMGAAELAHILLGDRTPGNLSIGIDVTVGMGASHFYVVESSAPDSPGMNFKPLTLDIPISGSDAGRLVMTGSVVSSTTGDITAVSTWLCTGEPGVAPSSTTQGNSTLKLTETNLTPVQPVAAGQQVALKVSIRFQ